MSKNPTYLLLSIIITLASCSDNTNQQQSAPILKIQGNQITFLQDSPELSVVTVQKYAQHTLKISGRLLWNEDETVKIFSPLDGRVIEVIVNIGQQVEAGQPLAAIQSPDFDTLQAEYRKAASNMMFTKKRLARQQELYEHGIVARKELEEAQASYTDAKTNLKYIESLLNPYGNPLHSTKWFYLKSPLAGTIVQRSINPGQQLNPNQGDQPLFIVTNPTSLWAQLDATEENLPYLAPSKQLIVTSKSYPKSRFLGEVIYISDFVDSTTRTVKVLAKIPNPDRKLKAQMYVTAQIPIHTQSNPTVITKAVVLDKDKFYVFISIGKGQYIRRQVEIGTENQGMTPILSGLQVGDRVVSEEAIYLNHLFQSEG
ncbi:efflux RND transporter periplasmic adaptor subunit [Candidatus Nitrosacidococcus tergens]|uniref:Multidrug transporter n=1 Tax=Candidatus Nitrosacidococcus tergens TaxID=553981 RepID=A0A7G1Q961_9GAMM|nr:efflux RND transporter periplasmic adaptor subunit [Candidatus Nitrosacidococcus tergens]CAB1275535.1 Multidrug transporter [Candidatus Nitrosacidococcus tergens]